MKTKSVQPSAGRSEPLGDGGPAFPIPDSHHANGQVQYGANGMSLRDYLASKADIPWATAVELLVEQTGRKEFMITDILKARADLKYWEADAMLAAREGSK